MLRITFLLVIGVLCVGVPALRAEEAAGDEAQIEALEAEVAVLRRALALFQKRFSRPRDRISDTNNLHMLVSLLAISGRKGPKIGADGRLDVYRFVRREEITEEDFDVFASSRAGIRPTNAEIKAGDYTHFPFSRYKGAATHQGPVTPWLWERYPHADGMRVVGYSSGAAKVIPEAEFQALMKKHGQDP